MQGSKSRSSTLWLKEKGYTQNSYRNIVNGPIQFLKFFDTQVKYRRSLGIYRTEISTRDHRLTVSELQEMGTVANLKEQIILEVFMLGLRVSDACRLEWKLFDVGNQEAPIPIEIITRKKGQIAKSFISQEFKEILDKYLHTIDKENKYHLQSARKEHLDEETLNWILKDLAKRANLNLRGNLHWHCGRKLFTRTAASLGVNQWNARMMIGKAVSKDILTYVNGVNLAKDFLKVSNVLRLKSVQANGRIGSMEEMVQLLARALMKMIEQEKRGRPWGAVIGLLAKGKLSEKEYLEQYLKEA